LQLNERNGSASTAHNCRLVLLAGEQSCPPTTTCGKPCWRSSSSWNRNKISILADKSYRITLYTTVIL